MTTTPARVQRIDLLGVEDVAGLLGVKESTIWRWCREGRLPCLKVGKRWRVWREAQENFLRERERSSTLAGQLGSFLQMTDNELPIAQNLDLLHRLDAASFRVGEGRDGVLVKFYGGKNSPPEELTDRFEQNGLATGRLRREGPPGEARRGPARGREDQLGRLIEEGIGGGRTVWASFDWVLQVDLEMALAQQKSLADLVGAQQLVVKTAPWKRLSKSGGRRRSGRRSPRILAPFWPTSPGYP